jgi:Acyl-protein synthetase, LuxE
VSPEQAAEREVLAARVRALIAAEDALERDAVLEALFAYQQRWLPAYARFCAQRTAHAPRERPWSIPALPTDAFRFARISSRDEQATQRCFVSSGTTQAERSTHAFADLSLYDAAAERAARRMLFPDCERMQLVILAPPEQSAPDSSLSYMLARFVEWFGAAGSAHFWPLDARTLAALTRALQTAQGTRRPLALLGTSFAFVHALDALEERRFQLPFGSRIMQTGGFKGRSRELSPATMRAWLADRFGLDEAWISAEYGMTELSSQLYETTLREAALELPRTPRTLWAPPWLRASVLDPERLVPAPAGTPGLVRIDDAANLDSVSAIQTADVGRAEHGGLTLLGRAQGAVPRGCSISADQLLGELP